MGHTIERAGELGEECAGHVWDDDMGPEGFTEWVMSVLGEPDMATWSEAAMQTFCRAYAEGFERRGHKLPDDDIVLELARRARSNQAYRRK